LSSKFIFTSKIHSPQVPPKTLKHFHKILKTKISALHSPYSWKETFPKLTLLLEKQPSLKEEVIQSILIPIIKKGTTNYCKLPDEAVNLIKENEAMKKIILEIADLDLIERILNKQ